MALPAKRGGTYEVPVGTVRPASGGYVKVKTAEDGFRWQHWVVIEAHLGRKLVPGENVHHLNGVRDDNRLENLELWFKQQPSGQRVEDLLAYVIAEHRDRLLELL